MEDIKCPYCGNSRLSNMEAKLWVNLGTYSADVENYLDEEEEIFCMECGQIFKLREGKQNEN